MGNHHLAKKTDLCVPSLDVVLAQKGKTAITSTRRSASSSRPRKDVQKETLAEICTSNRRLLQLSSLRAKLRLGLKEFVHCCHVRVAVLRADQLEAKPRLLKRGVILRLLVSEDLWTLLVGKLLVDEIQTNG